MATIDLDHMDRLGELLQKSIGISDLMQAAGESKAEVTAHTLTSTSWALRDMLLEAKEILRDVGGEA